MTARGREHILDNRQTMNGIVCGVLAFEIASRVGILVRWSKPALLGSLGNLRFCEGQTENISGISETSARSALA